MRQIEIFKFLQLSGKIDIFISHDWPLNIHKYGNTEELLRRKPFFEQEVIFQRKILDNFFFVKC